jgi:long-chain acyl-CoA synthetase
MAEIRSGERVRTTAELMERAGRAAAGFASLGIGRGDTVALYLRNDFPFLEASIGAGMVDAYPVPVNWHYTEDEARYLFENSGPKAIVIHSDLVAPIAGVIPDDVPLLVVPTPPEICSAYGIADSRADVPTLAKDWGNWLGGFSPLPIGAKDPPGSMIYTSGTTGRPKGVRRDPPKPEQAQLTAAILARGLGFATNPESPGEIVTIIAGPMYHSAPNAYGLVATRLGANVILEPRFDAEELLQLIDRHRVTHIHMVPIMFNRLLKLPEEVRRKYDVSSLRFVVHAAAPISPQVKRAMIEWWGPVINEYYGSTETGILVSCTSQEWLGHPGTVGKTISEADVRVIGAAGETLPLRAIGEVVGRTKGTADFTYHQDDAKRQKAEKLGLIAPGDVGYFDEDGYHYLCDRATDIVISGGVNIYPAEIEEQLHRMPGVADCAIFGIPDEEYGEALCAVIQPQPDVSLSDGDVKAYLRGRVAGYKMPKHIEFLSELPREDSGKIFKRKLREPYWAGHDRRI